MTEGLSNDGLAGNLPPDPSTAWPSAAVTLKSAARRLARLLERETVALRHRRPVDLDVMCDRKNQALLELSRLGQGLERDMIDPELQTQLCNLLRAIEDNRSVLELHLRAVRDVAEILATAIREAESDGTYSTIDTLKASV